MDFGLLIPVYKPTPQLAKLLDVVATRFSMIVLVDDGNTPEDHQQLLTLQKEGIVVLTHPENKGKGEALKTGFRWFLEHPDLVQAVMTADADGQHHPNDILNVMNAYASDPTAVHLGARDFSSEDPWTNQLGNRITRTIFRLLTGKKLKDTQTGLRVIPTDLLEGCLSIKGSRYDYEMGVLMHLVKKDIPIQEITIHTVYHQEHAFSSFKKWKDSFLIYQQLLGPFITFTLVSLSSFALDLVLFLVFYHLVLKTDPTYIFLAVIFARLISGLYNFVMNRVVTFQSQRSWVIAGSQYLALYLVILVGSSVGTQLFLPLFSMQPWLTKVIVDGLLFILSFFVQRTWIFKHG
jgi:glycosyltransferase involved in cell wall biosynthesis